MSGKLKIYACSGVSDEQGTFNYWTDNTDTLSNTQAVNTLLALINRNYIEVNCLRAMTPADKIANLNDIDVYTVCLQAAERFKDDDKALKHAGQVIGAMMAEGAFKYDSLMNTERDVHLDQLIDRFNEICNDGMPLGKIDLSFVEWFDQTVVARNKVGLTEEQQQKVQKALDEAVAGIGAADERWKEDKNISKYLLDAATYFLYTYLTDAQLRSLPAVFKYKRAKQVQVYNYCKQYFVGVYGSENEMREIIYSGIVAKFGETPEQVCADIVAGKREAVGIATEVVVALIGAAVSIVTALIPAMLSAIGTIISAKYGTIKKDIVNSSCPNPEDFDEVGTGSSKATSWLPLAAIGAALVLLMKR